MSEMPARVPLFVAPGVEVPPGPLRDYCEIVPEASLAPAGSPVRLCLDEHGLGMLGPNSRKLFRLTPASLPPGPRRRSLLLRACGALERSRSVFDPFLGFGLDALQLAMAGCRVAGMERQLPVWLMACDFADRMNVSLQIGLGDGIAELAGLRPEWDVVYLDPMFPARNKKALPGIAMQHLRQLAGEDRVDVGRVLDQARLQAAARVVLKRRLRDPVHGTPTFQLSGRAVRFDVYEA